MQPENVKQCLPQFYCIPTSVPGASTFQTSFSSSLHPGMARTNRRDCRTGDRKKTAANSRREDQIKAIRKGRKSSSSSSAAAVEADDDAAAAPAAVTGAAASFLEQMRAEVSANLKETVARVAADAAFAAAAVSSAKPKKKGKTKS